GAQVFGQTRATKSKARLQIGRGNVQLGISTHQPHDGMTVYTHSVAQPADLIGKSNLEGMKSITSQLQDLCLFQRYAIDGCFNVSIKLFDPVARPSVQLANDGIRRCIKIADGVSFAHEFRISNQTKVTSGLLGRMLFYERAQD